jgi:predicted deacylase
VGPTLFINAGVHGGEYPAIEAVIRLSKTLDPEKISGTVILMPCVICRRFGQERRLFVRSIM